MGVFQNFVIAKNQGVLAPECVMFTGIISCRIPHAGFTKRTTLREKFVSNLELSDFCKTKRFTMLLSKTEASYLSESIKPTTESPTTQPLRADGRPLLSFRPINIITNVSAQANGSARCQLSTSSSRISTDVMVGCKVEVDERDFNSIGAKVECTVDW